MLGSFEYSLLEQNCETCAFWAKTGKRYTGQTSKGETVLALATAGAGVYATGALLTATALTGFTTVDVTGAVVASSATVSAVWAGSIFVGLGVIAGTWLAFKAYSRRELMKDRPLEVIDLITELESRDKRSRKRDESYDHDIVWDTARAFDALLLASQRGAGAAMASPASSSSAHDRREWRPSSAT